jgi:hypothetical protein
MNLVVIALIGFLAWACWLVVAFAACKAAAHADAETDRMLSTHRARPGDGAYAG